MAPPSRLVADAGDVCTQKILVAAAVAGVTIAIEKPKAAGSPPELIEGHRVIRYTNAILRHVGRLFEDNDLYGSNFFESAEVDSWLDWVEIELGHESPPLMDQAIQALERALGDKTFLVGQRFTLADVSVSCSLVAMQKKGVAPATLPKATQRWLGACTHQDAFVAVAGAPSAAGAKGSSAAKAAKGASASTSAAAPAAAPAASEQPLEHKYCSAVGGRIRIGRILLAADGGKSMIGNKISVCGWVRTKREGAKGKLAFIELSDGSSAVGLQVVLDDKAKGFEGLKTVGTGASIKCIGNLVESPAKGQAVELAVGEGCEVVVFGGVDSKEYPLAKKEHTPEYLRSIAHLRPRSNMVGATARVRSALAFATHEFFQKQGFLYVHTPLITASDCEGAGEMFQITTMMQDAEKEKKAMTLKDGKHDYTKDFFGKPAFLTVSGQLAVEPYCCALSDVYTFGPTFRAENSHTSRHLAEFWMIEPEMAFADIMDDMQCAEDYLKHCVRYVMTNNFHDLEFFDAKVEQGLVKRLEALLKEPFGRVTYTEAVDILINEQNNGVKFETTVEWGIDLGSEHERHLVEKVTKKPTIVYNYPKGIKAFYMRLNDDEKTVAAMDLLVPQIGEVIGGSQREERLDVLDRRLEEIGLDKKDYWWYRDLRKYGSVPHSGFGLGFERLIMLCTGIENIRDVIPYPRYPGHADF